MSNDSLQIAWLVRVRWVGLLGQLVVYLIATSLIGIDLNPTALFGVSGTVAATNLFLAAAVQRPSFRWKGLVGSVLVADTLLLTALLHQYGGYTNPFAMLFLLHIVLASILLSVRWTWGISLLSIGCYAGLFFWYLPVPELSHQMSHHSSSHLHEVTAAPFDLHLQGMLVAFSLMALLLTAFLHRIRAELEQQKQELERRRANEEQLSALTTLSASVAHELGTPLGTMRFVVDDFAEGVFDRDPLVQRELTQLRAELDRCSRSLERLGARWGELRGEQPVSLCLSDLQKGVTESLPQSIRGRVIWTASSDQKICLPKESLTHVVGALVRNGIEASQEGKSVTVNGGIDHRAITIQVVDSGVGMSSQDLSRIGTPFFTTKDSGRGMGLGLFIAKLFADRLGGALEVKSDLGSGTSISLTIPNSGV